MVVRDKKSVSISAAGELCMAVLNLPRSFTVLSIAWGPLLAWARDKRSVSNCTAVSTVIRFTAFLTLGVRMAGLSVDKPQTHVLPLA